MYEMQLEVLQIIVINAGAIMTGVAIGSGNYGRRRDFFLLALNIALQTYNTAKLIESVARPASSPTMFTFQLL